MTTYAELRYGQEIQAYYDRRFKRVRIVSDVVTDGDRVRFAIAPTPFLRNPVFVTFAANAEVELHPDKLTRSYRNKQFEEWIAEALEVGLPSLSAREICDRIYANHKKRPSKEYARAVCNRMVKQGVLVKREGSVVGFRRPLAFYPGMPVQRFPAQPIQLGWIERVELIRSGRSEPEERAIVRWCNGIQQVCSDANLEPVTLHFHLKQIAVAQARLKGEVPDGFVEIPWWIFGSLSRKTGTGYTINAPGFIELAQFLGWLPEEARSLPGNVRNQCLDFLELYYPDWRERRIDAA